MVVATVVMVMVAVHHVGTVALMGMVVGMQVGMLVVKGTVAVVVV
jgi:hypothetical protein